MEDAVAIRRAATGAVDDVEPVPLRATIERHIADGSLVPGAFTLQAVRATTDGSPAPTGADGDLPEPIASRVAGVQLIYDGLRLTRRLAQDEPWTTGGGDTADVEILAADVMVARGFYLLARTEAAAAAVGVVRAFGHDQTVRRETDNPSLDRNLEADVLELAVVAGATVTGGAVPPRLREHAADLAVTPFPDPADFFAETDLDALSAMAADSPGSEGVTTVGDR
jgi:hypothetical protein